MKAKEARLLEFLRKSEQFIVPIYQRPYSWTDKECEQLWSDILHAGSTEATAAHFVGSIVYIESGLYSVSHQSPLLVIDGQQRLTSLSLLLEALARRIGTEEPLEGFTARKIRNYYLVNPEEEGERRYKLIPSTTDKATYLALVDNAPEPSEPSVRVRSNFEFFTERLSSANLDLEAICRGVSKLMVVDISLDRQYDNPQLIFESLNSTGLELTQADLARNFVLMGQEPQMQEHLYLHHWRPMEEQFGQEAYTAEFSGFLRHYLTVKLGRIPILGEVYEEFKTFSSSAGTDTEVLLADIRLFANYYCRVALDQETDDGLRLAFRDLRELRVAPATPVLLELYGDYEAEILSREDFIAVVRMLESYVFRRFICDVPTNSLSKTFANLLRQVDKERYRDSIAAQLLSMTTYKRFPSDDEFVRAFKGRDLYNIQIRSYWLRRLENAGRKEPISVNEFTIEHVMPQNEDVPDVWRAELGPDWRRVHDSYLHTLGNLTLTGYNSELSDRSFAEKKSMTGGFSDSPIRIHDGLAQAEVWNEEAMLARADRLAARALNVWASPRLDAAELAALLPDRPDSEKAQYSLADHPQLSGGIPRELFEALQTEILALDPAVTMEPLKHYVAFKAETNFVDIIPQSKLLRLALNMPYPQLNDPRGIAIDVTAVGSLGNGDAEVRITDIEDVPYVMGLVRQSLETQLGSSVQS